MTFIQETALVYCDDQFGLVDGKTANALVRHSDTYTIVGVIDRQLAGKDAGEVLGDAQNSIPIFANLADALSQLSVVPHHYIYGKATLEAHISVAERYLILEAIQNGMNIINGLHQFFSEDREFAQMAAQYHVQITDLRKPPQLKDLQVFNGTISQVNVPVIAVLGTDCACGKMTTAVELDKALNQRGIKSVMVATGQTALVQGAKYGASIDALVSQFVIGEIEQAVVQAFNHEAPDIILVEGQSAVSHPAFMSSIGILKGSMPDGVILQHPPGRKFRCDFPQLAMPTLESEIKLIQAIAQSPVLAITLSHENLTDFDVQQMIQTYERDLRLPTTDVLSYGCEKLIQVLGQHFPQLTQKVQHPRSFDRIPLLAH